MIEALLVKPHVFAALPQLVETLNDAGRRGVRGIVVLKEKLFVVGYSSSCVEVYKAVHPFGSLTEVDIKLLDVPCEISAHLDTNEVKVIDHNGGSEWIIDAVRYTVKRTSEPCGPVDVRSAISSEHNQYIYRIDGTHKAKQLPTTFSSNHVMQITSDHILVADRKVPRVVLMNSNFEEIRVLLDKKHFPENDEPWRLSYSEDYHLLYVGLRNGGIRVYNWKY